MESKNRYKFVFGEKSLTLTTDKDNLFMEEVERVAKEKLPQADNETIAILMALNLLSTQLSREIEVEKMEKELTALRSEAIDDIKEKASKSDSDEE